MSNVAQAITWSRDAGRGTHLPKVLPQQVAALQAIAAAISLQAAALDDETRHAVGAVVRDTAKLAAIVQRRASTA